MHKDSDRGLRVVFDIDDTISRVQVKGDYANAEEIEAVTEQIRRMKAQGHTIILHTARGMVSCGGDVQKAREKNEKILTEWLAQHDVPYDEIWWGKPYADVYVDDKGVSAGDLARLGTSEMRGFSGARVTRVGTMVVKQAENVSEQAKWYKETREKIESKGWELNVPEVFSCNFGKLYMESVFGRPGTEVRKEAKWGLTREVAHVLKAFREDRQESENDVDWYKGYVGNRAEEIGVSREQVEQDIEQVRGLLKERTYCHGDLTLSNIMVTPFGLTLIDPSVKEVESWLLDASKFRASLRGLDDIIQGRERDTEVTSLQALENELGEEWTEAIELLERGHWIRVARYAKVLGRQGVFERLMGQIRQWYG